LKAVARTDGTVLLTWNKSAYPQLQSYLLTGGPAGSFPAPRIFNLFTEDTTYVYRPYDSVTYDSQPDTASYTIRFRVRIVTQSNVPGPLFGPDTATVHSPFVSRRWHRALANAPFSGRYRHGAFVFNNRIWVTGGTTDGGSISSDLWSSADGITWEKVADNLYGSVTVFQGQLWHIRNDIATQQLSVSVSNDGSSWSSVTTTAMLPGIPFNSNSWFNARVGAVNFQNKLWLFGMHNNSTSTPRKMLHSSPDGVSWTQVFPVYDSVTYEPGQGFLSSFDQYNQREYFSSNRIAFNGKMWAVGGYNYMFGSSFGANPFAWSSADGQNWEYAATPFSPRYAHALAEHDGKIWVIGGLKVRTRGSANPEVTPANDVWSSTDGVSWKMVDLRAPFEARHGHAAVSFQGKLWVIGGAEASDLRNESGIPFNDVWYYE
jgi:hypothetical protein